MAVYRLTSRVFGMPDVRPMSVVRTDTKSGLTMACGGGFISVGHG